MNKKQQSTINQLFKTYIVDALSYMSMGLFCSLILGLIIKQIALISGLNFLKDIATLLHRGGYEAAFQQHGTSLITHFPERTDVCSG